MKTFETTIFENLLQQEEYCQAVVSFIKREYFQTEKEKIIFDFIHAHFIVYKKLPTKLQLFHKLDQADNLNEAQFNEVKEVIDDLESKSQEDLSWLLKETEEWAKERAMYNGLTESILISEGKDPKKSKSDIPNIMTDALSISLDQHVGHDFFDDASDRWDNYWKKEDRIPFDLDILNNITNGGLPNKTLTLLSGGTGAGKSLCKCHMSAAALLNGYDVLYITLELSEEKVAERIDANLLDIRINDLKDVEKQTYEKKILALKKKSAGRLFIKEYPSGSAGVNQFRYLIRELAIKKKFKPNIIFVDYLNICSSSRLNSQARSDSYGYHKSIAEELRGFAQELNVPVVTSTQLNRTGMQSSDPEITDTSESMGVGFTADLFLIVWATDELKQAGQLMFKQGKNRLNDDSVNRKFVINVDKSKMKLSDCNQSDYISEANQEMEPISPSQGRNQKNRDFSRLDV